MKNKEIEELLNELKNEDNYIEEYGFRYKRIGLDDWGLLLSYIEQLEKRNKQIYEGFMATQEELTDYATENEQLENENQQLKKQKDDVVKALRKLKNRILYEEDFCSEDDCIDDILRMLGEIDD